MSKSQRFFVFIFYFQTPVFLTNALIHSCFFIILWIWVPFVSLALSDGVTDTILCNLPNSFCVMKKQNYCPSHWTWEFSRCLIIVWFGIFEFFSPLISLVKHVLLLGSPFDAHIVELVKGVWGKKKGKFKVVVFLEFIYFFIVSAFT